VVQLAGAVEVHDRRRGRDRAVAATRRHRGGEFDPSVVDAFCTNARDVLEGLDEAASWDAVLDTEPWPQPRVTDDDLDAALEAIGDAVDLKSPHMAGHSRGVARLAAEGARVAGMDARDTTALRRAGLVHDLGRLGVSNALWDQPAPLTDAEKERVRLHPYLTDRMLARVPALSTSRVIASRHHERLDGSGYTHGLTAASLTASDRLLAAADTYHAMTEPRPYRTSFPDDVAARRLNDEVEAGRLDGDAVASILVSAGHRAPPARRPPAGLTAREVEVLKLLARGNTNKQIARLLVMSPKTASNHIEHIYSKLSVNSRAAATLCAIQEGLVGSYEAPTGTVVG
jgi:HD-GYP domain-containing protein (c-di-GMP phosphodiesterase class II)